MPAGYIQFGKGPGLEYDPVSFDLKSRNKNGDYRIVKIDHEEILCNNRIKLVAELVPSFEHLVRQTIDQANPHLTLCFILVGTVSRSRRELRKVRGWFIELF